jgi:hypothetical protein
VDPWSAPQRTNCYVKNLVAEEIDTNAFSLLDEWGLEFGEGIFSSNKRRVH